MHETLASPEWFEALTLAERAARKAVRSRSECDLLDDAVFTERLALEGLTPERFLRILFEVFHDFHPLPRRDGRLSLVVPHLPRCVP